MADCKLEGFFCASHGCGMTPEGELKLCMKEGCPHCGKPKRKLSGKAYRRLVEDHGRAQAAVLRWEDKLGRTLSRLQTARAEERKLRLKMEKAERDGVEPEAEEAE